MSEQAYPSVMNLKCPSCGSENLRILGSKGSVGKAVGAGMFGAIGNMVASADSKRDFQLIPIRYQCQGCKNKFESLPETAPDDDVMETPCTIVFHRLGSMVGAAVNQQVYLNGVKMGNVKNGGELRFQTFTRHNTIFVTDHSGIAFPGDYKFIAKEGETVDINYKRKFL